MVVPWYLNPALTRWRLAVNGRFPGRDKTSDGTLGDARHAAGTSDHNEDLDGTVDAWDMDVDGVDVELCKTVFQAHEASKYWIHNDQIAQRSKGWKRESYAYAGPNRNRHNKHVHWNSREDHEKSTAPWIFPQQGGKAAVSDTDKHVEAMAWRLLRFLFLEDMQPNDPGNPTPGKTYTLPAVAALRKLNAAK